jgi:hypothetical protein
LQLRFTYDVLRPQSEDDEAERRYDRYLQAAYLQTDIDCVKIIRRLADAGEL